MSTLTTIDGVDVGATFGAAFVGLVAGAVVLDTLHLILCARTIYWYLISNFNNPANLDLTTWSMALQTDCNGIIAVMVECFFARRVWLMSKNWYITLFIVILAILHFALGVVFTAESFILGRFSKFKSLTWVTCTGFSAAAASDIAIALSMCYYLSRKRTGIDRINTGLLTRCVSFAIMPTNFVWLCFFWLMGKCICIILLNSRNHLRDKAYASAIDLSPVSRGTNSLNFRGAPIVLQKSLRDALLSSLSTLPGTRNFHIHVLVSSPRKHSGLFPYAHPRPRVYLQDIFILLSEKTSAESSRVLVTAIEASVYNIPSTSCGVLYVSKVDTSGHGSQPSPTPSLVRALLTYYADPATRPINVTTLWIQLFARAQGQYLFPNSSDYAGKRPLSDIKLCAWWRRIFGQVAAELEERMKGREEGKTKLRLFYLLPGYNELEAEQSLKGSGSSSSSKPMEETDWTYGHQYSQTDIPLPCPRVGSQNDNLGHYVPSFDDDPKSRFLDDIAHTTEANGVKSPKRKRTKSATQSHKPRASDASEKEPRDHETKPSEPHIPQGELGKVTVNEFWERMSFRQECVAGAVTGFFALGITSIEPEEKTSGPSPLAPQPGQVPFRLIRRVVSTLMTALEFSTVERATRATETLEGSIKGLCEDITTIQDPSVPAPSAASLVAFYRDGALPPENDASSSTTLDVPKTPPRKGGNLPDISPNPFPEPVTSLETYRTHIFGSLSVKNPLPSPKDAPEADTKTELPKPVNVLTVRRKKRKVES
ncbi:hypothetical protein K474DRAFT_1681935 [Panus rudis PR-1116 ss-1]|nr:hypothetical protein K474DRAFT_1681935 [Panus rudis PR-1116 ss-1]